MNVVGKVGSFISQGVYSVATPFHPFGGAVDVIVVRQQDGTFRSTPWYVRFGKFQGVLKGSEKFVHISVNGTEADFHMYLDNSGKAYFIHELEFSKEDDSDHHDQTPLDRTESDANGRYYDFQDEQESSVGFSEFNSNQFESIDEEQPRKAGDNDSEVVLVSVDGHVLTAPVSNSEESSDNIRLSTPQFHLGPADGEEEIVISEIVKNEDPEPRVTWEVDPRDEDDKTIKKHEVFQSCLELTELTETVKTIEIGDQNDKEESSGEEFTAKFEISLCGKEMCGGMGIEAAEKAFEAHRVTPEKFKSSPESIANNETLIVRFKEKYFPWQKAAPHILGLAAFNFDITLDPKDAIPVEEEALNSSSGSRRWTLWPNPFRRTKTLDSNSSSEDYFVDTESVMSSSTADTNPVSHDSPKKKIERTNVPTNEQIASLNLRDGQNLITFNFSTRVLGKQQVEAHLYLWKWNTRIVISDVDGTITKSDVLGQFMPLVGKDWSQSGVAKLFSAIKENGYQLLFLSARAIVQAYLTKNFLFNLKQDGKTLPNGPVVISPDGLFPSLFREVIRRAPHEFKIACLEDIKSLFPPDYNPFYAGFGNRDTDELSYRKIGIPKGKIFIINPKGEVAVSHSIDVKSYTNLHTLVNDMFPPTSLVEEEDFNSWNFWKFPLPDIDL